MRKIITTIILCSMIFSTSFIYGENEQLDLEKKLNENRDSQQRLDEQIIELNSKIKEVEEKIASTNEEINELDLQINDIKSEINDLENNIKNNKDQLSKRIKVINSNYSMSYIKILLNSSSISDFFNNMYIVKKIVKQDKEILTELDENKQKIEDKKNQIEKKKVEVEKLKDELEKEENALELEIEKISSQSVVSEDSQVISSGSWPVPGYSRISSPYGYRIHPIFNTKKMHTGIDIPAPTGTPAVSIDQGKVIFSGTKGGYGKTIMIQHDDGKVTLYAHNSELIVSVGQRVQKGQVVSKIGSTGNSTGPHLHFEVRINGKHVNPVPYIK